MKKITRLNKAWQRNQELWIAKGVYFNFGKLIKHCLTPKQVLKELTKEKL